MTILGTRTPRPAPTSFALASFSLLTVFAAAGTAIPLFNTYRTEDGITPAQLAVVAVTYLLSAAVSLLLLGRLSSHVGRKPVAAASLIASALGCASMIGVHSIAPLLIGRVLQGLACGIASSALGAYIVDVAPAKPRWLAPLVTSTAPMLGVPSGAIVSGILVTTAPAPRVLGFCAVSVALVLCAVGLALGPETAPRATGAARRAFVSLRPRIGVPVPARPLFLALAPVLVGTWALGGYYQAFGPSVAADRLGSSNPLVAAGCFASYVVLSPLGGVLASRLGPATAVRVGTALYVLSLAGVLGAVARGGIVPFVASSLLAGVGQGIAVSSASRAVLSSAAPGERAGVLSTIYLVSYAGAGLPAVVAGQVSHHLGLLAITVAYVVLAAAGALAGMVLVRDPLPVGTAAGRSGERPSGARPSGTLSPRGLRRASRAVRAH